MNAIQDRLKAAIFGVNEVIGYLYGVDDDVKDYIDDLYLSLELILAELAKTQRQL